MTVARETRKDGKAQLVFFEEWVDPAAEAVLGRHADIDLHRLRYVSSRNINDAAMAAAHGYQVQARTELRDPWFGDAALLARCPNLLAMSSTGAGYDYIDVDACTAAGVLVLHQSGTNAEAVAEHALGMMLVLSKRIALADRLLRRAGSAPVDRYRLQGNDLLGKTVGIVGLGRIGSRTAELCGGLLNMKVLAYDPHLDKATVAGRGAEKVELDDLLVQSDVVSVHCPRSAQTMNMFGAAEFGRMKPGALFINTARGGIHDEEALAEALRGDTIAGAGVDVFLKEPPPPNHPLLQLDNVLASPHTAGITTEALKEMAVAAAQQWVTLLKGGVPPRIVNPEAWPLYARRFQKIRGFAPAPRGS